MLVKLVAIDGVGEEISEVVPEVERALDDIEARLRGTALAVLCPASRQREAVRSAAVAGIEFAVEPDLARSDRARRNLVGRIPLVHIGHAGQRKAIVRGALAVARNAVELAQRV